MSRSSRGSLSWLLVGEVASSDVLSLRYVVLVTIGTVSLVVIIASLRVALLFLDLRPIFPGDFGASSPTMYVSSRIFPLDDPPYCGRSNTFALILGTSSLILDSRI